ncbi:hypothetical protein V8F20_005453 [Naviculisporaceae sp. PSN 640]
MATTDWGRLTVVDLRHELKQRGLSTVGKKADLVERLTAAESEQNDNPPANGTADHGAEAHVPGDTSEATYNDGNSERIEISEQVTESNSTTKPEYVEKPEPPADSDTIDTTDTSQPIKHSGPIAKAEPVEKSVLSENPEQVEDSKQVTESNPTTEPERVANAEPAPETEPVKKFELATEPDTIETSKPIERSEPIAESEPVGEPELAPPDLSRDVGSRKRRSRTPPPSDDESSRKRARPEHHPFVAAQIGADPTVREEVLPLDDDPSGHDTSYAKLLPDISAESHGREALVTGELQTANQPHNRNVASNTLPEVEPSVHPPTEALYIRNFMRPLREQELRDYITELATPPGSTPDDNIIRSFFLDKLRSHVFVEFDSVAAAQRTRAQVHTKIWPEESTRKALWADFIPPERIPGWVDVEERNSGRGQPTRRWEVIYEVENGEVKLELIDGNDPQNKPRLMGKPGTAIPTGPARQFSGIEGPPSGPRGHGGFRDSQAGQSLDAAITASAPAITFTPVSDHLVRQRLHNLRSLQTTDRKRIIDRWDDRHRYTFQFNDIVIDRGLEYFEGVRRPAHLRSPDRNRNQYRPDRAPPYRDRYVGGGRDRFPDRDDPRSRFDAGSFATFRGRGGGGGRSRGRGGWGGGSGRPHYWGHR